MHSLETLVREYEANPVANGRAMRALVQENGEALLETAAPLLRAAEPTPGFQYLLGALAANGCAIRAVADPRFLTDEEAIRLARQLATLDPLFVSGLARTIFSTEESTGHERLSAGCARLLEILEALSDEGRFLPVLMTLFRHPHPNVRSKAALLVGRTKKSHAWVAAKLDEPDARLRANAIESLWDAPAEGCRPVLWVAAGDPNNRVALNAVLGLYRLGDAGSIAVLAGLAHSPAALFRASAAWAMGETGDDRFIPILGRMITDAEPLVRRNALAALLRSKKLKAGEIAGPVLELRLHSRGPVDEFVQLQVLEKDRHVRAIHGTAFRLFSAGQHVLDYSIEETAPAEASSERFRPRMPLRPGYYTLRWEPPNHQFPLEVRVHGAAGSGQITAE